MSNSTKVDIKGMFIRKVGGKNRFFIFNKLVNRHDATRAMDRIKRRHNISYSYCMTTSGSIV